MLTGELRMLRTQADGYENDMKEFRHTNKKYTEQLVKVKARIILSVYAMEKLTFDAQMSDMANNDLEKYAKALDKYVYDLLL